MRVRQPSVVRFTLASLLVFSSTAVQAGGIAHNFNGRWGGMEIYDAKSTLSFRVNLPRLTERVAPCSTFFLPAAVVAMKSGMISPSSTEIHRDETRWPAAFNWPSAWKSDRVDLTAAARDSVPWYLQEIANKRGAQKIKADLIALKYGNGDISGGMDRFWQTSSLTVSALEQVDFLRAVRDGKVGLTQPQTATLLNSLELRRDGEYVMYGKTGSCARAEGDYYGLFFGLVELAGQPRAYFSMSVDGVSVSDVASARQRIVMDSLIDLGFWPAPVEPDPIMVAAAGGVDSTATGADPSVSTAATVESSGIAPDSVEAAVATSADSAPVPATESAVVPTPVAEGATVATPVVNGGDSP